MQDQVLLSVTEILDDSTGIWAGDLCEFSIHSGDLEDFLKGHGQKGAEEICKTLDYLKKAVMEEYLPKSQENQEKEASTMKYKITKQAWESIGEQAGWVRLSAMNEDDIRENARFYDSSRHQSGKLVTRKYHQTTGLWMMLYDDGEIEELHMGDLEHLEIVKDHEDN